MSMWTAGGANSLAGRCLVISASVLRLASSRWPAGVGAALLLIAAAPRPPLPTRFTDMAATRAIAPDAWHGRTTVISFWARWCGPCLAELPKLPALAAANPDLRFVAASLDGRRSAGRWLAENPLPGIVTVHATGAPGTVLRMIGDGQQLLPFNIVVDAAGRVCAITGYSLDADQLARLLAVCRAN